MLQCRKIKARTLYPSVFIVVVRRFAQPTGDPAFGACGSFVDYAFCWCSPSPVRSIASSRPASAGGFKAFCVRKTGNALRLQATYRSAKEKKG